MGKIKKDMLDALKKTMPEDEGVAASSAPQTKGFKRRMVAIAVLVFIILLFFVARLVQFQIIEGSKHAAEASRQQAGSSRSMHL